MVLTARDSVSDRVAGLQAGADDYLLKPFDLRELCARLLVDLAYVADALAVATAKVVTPSALQIFLRVRRLSNGPR